MTPLTHIDRIIAANHQGQWQVSVRRGPEVAVGDYDASFETALLSAQQKLKISPTLGPVGRRNTYDLTDLLR